MILFSLIDERELSVRVLLDFARFLEMHNSKVRIGLKPSTLTLLDAEAWHRKSPNLGTKIKTGTGIHSKRPRKC